MLNELIQDLSPEDYLRLEAQSAVRHEYVGGGIFAMAVADPRHAAIAGNLFAALRARLSAFPHGRVFAEGAKLHVAPDNAYYYPDLMVSLDPRPQGAADREATIVDRPVVLVEVLSESTAGTDRREKLVAYRKLASLREYVLVEQATARVEVFRRAGEAGWQRILLGPGESLDFASLGFSLPLAEIYAGVDR